MKTKPAKGASRSFAAAALIVAAATAAYANSFSGAFVFDDLVYVMENPALRSLWPPYDWLGFCPSRPLPYFTFAVNRALHGVDEFGYHVVNLAIHISTALALFGLVRRTLVLPNVAERYRAAADGLATVIALAWVVHPLCTQAVTYVYQRLESLAALFMVCCWYAFVRAYGDVARPRRGWSLVSAASVYAAMLCKESAAALPLLTLLYDRLFLAETWRDVSPRRRYHAAAFCAWGVALGLIVATGSDYGKAGIASIGGITPLSYALSQSGVLLHYLRLSFWPSGQCLDYGWPVAREWHQFVPQTAVVLGLLSLTGWGVYRGRMWSFPGCVFFLVLAPTSSIVPIADLMFEHRMYLPLAAVIALSACGAFELLYRSSSAETVRQRRLRWAAVACGGICIALAVATHFRNRDYADPLVMWHDCMAKAPNNPRSYYLLGQDRMVQHRFAEAEEFFYQALDRDPNYAAALLALAHLRIVAGRLEEAAWLLEQPTFHNRYDGWHVVAGELCEAQGRFDEAAAHYAAALEINPLQPQAHGNLGVIAAKQGRHEEAAALYRRAAEIDLRDPSPRNNLGTYYAMRGEYALAEAAFRDALRVDPLHAESRANLGSLLDRTGRGDEALAELQRAVNDEPTYIGGQINLGTALARRGRLAEAVRHLEKAVELDPENELARANLAQAKSDLQAVPDAGGGGLATP
jgi:tetratricopeptide (TPR) repeat protein